MRVSVVMKWIEILEIFIFLKDGTTTCIILQKQLNKRSQGFCSLGLSAVNIPAG